MAVFPQGCGEGMAKTPVRKPKAVSLRYLLDSEPKTRGGSGCKTCGLLRELSEDDAAALREYLGNPDVPTSRVSRALERYGRKISISAVARHRRECP